MSSKPIGIFDSGIGGLTVMRAVRKLLPFETLVYLGDTARVPYGTKSAETILRHTEECLAFLAKKDVKAIVIACNSASAHAFPYLKTRFHFPILGVIESGVKEALSATRNKIIGVIGTEATISSDVYVKELKKLDEKVTVVSLACPLFVPLVEVDWLEHPVTLEVAKHYLGDLKSDGVDTLILGCTHYPLLKNVIRRVMGEEVRLIDSAEALAGTLKTVLEGKNLLNGSKKGGLSRLYVTDLPNRFEVMANRFLGDTPLPVKRITL